MESNLIIRPATLHDVQPMLDIYAPYVSQTAVSFEYDVPSLKDFQKRLITISEQYPWLVIEKDGHIEGYAYASSFHPRAAYRWSAEASIYLRMDARGKGLGRRLYLELENILKAQHFYRLYACIAHIAVEDEYLSHASIRFHERMGYRLVGSFPECAFKFQRWYGMCWMEKRLADSDTPSDITPFPNLISTT